MKTLKLFFYGTAKVILLFLLIVLTSLSSKSQVIPTSLLVPRAAYLSKQLKINVADATALIKFIDLTTESINKVYHDSTLTSVQKRDRIKGLENAKDLKLIQVVTDKKKLRMVRKTGELKHNKSIKPITNK